MGKTLSIDLRWVNSSGIGTYIKGLMPGLVDAFRDIQISALGPLGRLLEFSWAHAPHVEVIDCKVARYSPAEQIVLPLRIPRRTDLFFSPHYPIPLFYGGRIAVTVHDLSHLVVPEIAGNFLKRSYAATMLRNVRQRASLILSVSDFSKSELLRCTQGPRSDNILTIHEGVSDEWYRASASQPFRPGPYLVYVGNVKPYKNVSRLVEAFITVKDRVPHDLLIIGQYEGLITGESKALFERARSADGRIHFTGPVPQKDLLALVAHADALVLPSLYEGFGFPPLEAMASGVPTLVSGAASLPEICGNAALYCDPLSVDDIAEKIVSVVTDQEIRCHLVRLGKHQASKYSWDICARQTADALRSVL
jgi:glycosyltransferase involved in cell wall biosynthesis